MSGPVDPRYWLLRRNDQIAIAAISTVSLVLLAGWWFWHGGHQNRLIEIDQAEKRTARFEVDINHADMAELMQVPGIGPKLAGRIVASRNTDGPFTSPEDLRRVHGIGQKVLERIRPFLQPMITTGSPSVEKTLP